LREQQKELQRLNESKDEFISLASHQLRTPATAIKQLLGLLIEGYVEGVPENIMGVLKKTYESNERQISIVNSLLKVAQIDSGKIVLRKQSVDINEIVTGLANQYEGVIGDKKQTISLSLHDGPLYGYVDEHYYRMALENVLDNASKYTEAGGSIQISSKSTDEQVVVSIADTGIGIKSENIPKLFNKFNRISNELSYKVAGSGLGLYWVEKVINLHQGEIEVESEIKVGTTFSIKVPKGL
jgi:signal transduction histidine kinase